MRYFAIAFVIACGAKPKTISLGAACTQNTDCGAGMFCTTDHVCDLSCDKSSECGGTQSYTVGGAVNGLLGTLVLANGTETLSLTSPGPFVFVTKVSGSYAITVTQQPAGQVCTVSNGAGSIAGADVSNVAVDCISQRVIRAVIHNLPGDIGIAFNGTTQTVTVASGQASILAGDGSSVTVTVSAQPPGVLCSPVPSTPIVVSADTDVAVYCLAAVENYFSNGTTWVTWVDGYPNPPPRTALICSAPTTVIYEGCVHAGQRLFVDVSGISTCAGYAAQDSLAAFNWVCEPNGDHIAFVSTGLAHGKHLSSLVDFDLPITAGSSSFRPNHLTVTTAAGDPIPTPDSIWWADTFQDLSPNCAGDIDGHIQLAKSCSGTGPTTHVSNSNLAVVVKAGAVMGGFTGGLENFSWIEGSFDGGGILNGLTAPAPYIVFDNVAASNFVDAGITVGSHNVTLRDVFVSNNGSGGTNDGGVLLTGDQTVSEIRLTNVWAANNNQHGIIAANGPNNFMHRIRAFNNANIGVALTGSGAAPGFVYGNNVLFDVLSVGNGGQGIELVGDRHVIMATTTVGNGNGVYLSDAQTRASDGGVDDGSYDDRLVAIAAVHDGGYGLSIGNRADGFIGSNYSTTDSYNGLWAASGVGVSLLSPCHSHNSFAGELCAPTGICGSVSTSAAPDVDLFIGEVGSTPYSSSLNWFSVSEMQAWHVPTTLLSDDIAYGQCTAGLCALWDFRLKAGMPNALLKTVTSLSAQDTAQHFWDLAAASNNAQFCAAQGATYFSGNATCYTTMVLGAAEISGDDVGNDNLLCESNERCLILHNAGAYQGTGPLVSVGVYAGSGVNNVQVFEYSINGEY